MKYINKQYNTIQSMTVNEVYQQTIQYNTIQSMTVNEVYQQTIQYNTINDCK